MFAPALPHRRRHLGGRADDAHAGKDVFDRAIVFFDAQRGHRVLDEQELVVALVGVAGGGFDAGGGGDAAEHEVRETGKGQRSFRPVVQSKSPTDGGRAI
jgi:hypothetical protein